MPRRGSKKYKSKPVLQYTTWVFSLLNWTWDELAALSELTFMSPERKVASIAWSEEICPKTGTPHLQGFLQLYKKSM